MQALPHTDSLELDVEAGNNPATKWCEVAGKVLDRNMGILSKFDLDLYDRAIADETLKFGIHVFANHHDSTPDPDYDGPAQVGAMVKLCALGLARFSGEAATDDPNHTIWAFDLILQDYLND